MVPVIDQSLEGDGREGGEGGGGVEGRLAAVIFSIAELQCVSHVFLPVIPCHSPVLK